VRGSNPLDFVELAKSGVRLGKKKGLPVVAHRGGVRGQVRPVEDHGGKHKVNGTLCMPVDL
jgi:hypothetical protein